MAKKFYIKGKEEIKDIDAPVISDEFIDTTREEGEYHGQSIQVQSDTKLESDQGTGETIILRTYRWSTNPEIFNKYTPDPQEIFESHKKGILGFLWQDGMTPAPEIEPKFVLSEDRKYYWIIVGARPSVGQVVVDTPKTLTEILHDTRPNRDKVHGSVPVSSTKKTKTGRTTKASQ